MENKIIRSSAVEYLTYINASGEGGKSVTQKQVICITIKAL